MRTSLYLLLLSALFSCNSAQQADEKETERNDSISKLTQRRYSDSMKQTNPLLILPPDSTYTGDYIDKYPSGVVKFRGQFRFGKRHGAWLSFYPHGGPCSEVHYDKGIREGANITYVENDNKLYEGFYKNDRQDSIWVYYDSTGKIAKRVLFKNDRVVKY